jgi:two-component system sensor histidine kinase YesM
LSIKLSKLRHYFHDLSIFKKTFYGISLIIIFISLFSLIFSYSYTSDIFVERVLDNVGVLVKSLNRNMENDINQIDRIITSIYAESKKVNSDQLIMREIISTKSYESLEEQYWAVQAANDFFQQMLYLREDFSNVYIYVSPEKTFSYTLSGKSRMEYDPTDDDWYKRTVEADGETLIFPPHLPFQIDDVNEVVSFAKLLKNIDDIRGEPYGVILIDISLKRLRQAVGDYAMDSQTKVLFLDENDQPIYSQNIDVDEEMFDTSVYPYIRDKNDGSFITTVSQNKYLAAFQTSEISGWKLLILTPSSRILEESRGILITFSVLSLTAILLALTLAFVFSKVLYRPIRAILSGIDQVNKGDFHSFVDFESKDELGMLVKSFNEMVYRTRKMVLERYEEKLARNNAEFKYLQAQINPHFIYNSLQIINSIALVHKIPDLQAVSRDLAKIMRYSIPSDESLVSLKKRSIMSKPTWRFRKYGSRNI